LVYNVYTCTTKSVGILQTGIVFEELSGKPVKNEIMIWDVGPFWIPLSTQEQ
jgi:hypothetical protein